VVSDEAIPLSEIVGLAGLSKYSGLPPKRIRNWYDREEIPTLINDKSVVSTPLFLKTVALAKLRELDERRLDTLRRQLQQ
jgi:hypothetical protein